MAPENPLGAAEEAAPALAACDGGGRGRQAGAPLLGSRLLGRRVWLVALLVVGTFSLAPAPSRAQVTNTLDDVNDPPDGSLRSEVEAAPPGGLVRIEIPSDAERSTIDLDGLLRFEDSLIIGNSNPAFEIYPIVAPEQGSFLEIDDDVELELRDVVLRGDSRSTDDVVDLLDATSTLIVDLTREDQTYNVDIVGSGRLVKRGSKALELTGENNFSGGITVEQGDLIGDFLSIASPGMGTIALEPGGGTARVVFDVSGPLQILGPNPAITADESNGGEAIFVKDGSADLDVQGATIDPEIEIVIERGDLIVGPANLANGHDFEIESTGTLRITNAPISTFTGALSGSGTLEYDPGLLGAGALTVTGDVSDFSGELEVLDGTLVSVLLDPTSPPSSSLNFSVDLEGGGSAFEIADDDGLTFAGNLTGAGSFLKSGVGTTRLTGNASHTGGTNVLGGILIGDTKNLQGTISVQPAAELHFDQSSDASFSGSIESPAGALGGVRKLGSGTLTLGATQSFMGTLTVEDGGLDFAQGVGLSNANLVIGNSDADRGTLSSTFVTSGTQATNTTSIGGGLTLNDDARLLVTLSDKDATGAPGRRSTLFDAAGAIVVGSNTTTDSPELVVDLVPGSYSGAGTGPYTILQGGSLTVVEDFIFTESLFYFDVSGGAVGSSYQISLVDSGNTLEDAASSHNQREVGGALDNLRDDALAGDPDLQPILEVLNTLNTDDVGETLDALSGDILSASTNVRLAVAKRTWGSLSQRFALARHQSIGHHDALQQRRRETQRSRILRGDPNGASSALPAVDAGPPQTQRPWVGWFEVRGLNGDLDSDDAEGYGYKAVGPLIGADKAIHENVRVGFATAGTRYVYDADGSNNKGTANAVEGSLYGMWVGDPVEVLFGVRYGHSWIDTKRIVRFDQLQSWARDDFEGDEFGFYAEVTRAFGSPSRVEIAPFASLAYHHVMYDNIDEGGRSPVRMEVDSDDVDSAVTSLGFRVDLEREMDQGIMLRPHLEAAWGHEWADVEREVNGEFVAGGGSLNLEGAEMPRDVAELTVGWEVGYNKNASVYIDWDGRFGEDLVENALTIGLRAAW